MNIKGVVSNLIPVDFKKRDLRKTRNEPDRDPQSNQGGDENLNRHRFTEEELQEALKILKEIPGIKQNNLQFRVERNDLRVVIFVEDSTGKVIRRIPDQELWALIKSKMPDPSRGNLLNKTL